MHPDLITALAHGDGLILRRRLPGLRGSLDAALRRGELVAVLHGVYARPDTAATLGTRARAACLADPNAIITGAAAAILGGWTDLEEPEVVTVATEGLRGRRPGFRFERRSIPRALTRSVEGARITTRPLTALDLAVEHGPWWIDDALRRGLDPADLRRALDLCPGRRGFGRLRAAVHAIRDRPWSILERRAHLLLRQAHIGGWEANRAVYARRDELLGYGDLVFAHLRLVIELDGAAAHSSPGDRDRDAARDLRFARAGWEVVRVKGRWVTADPEEFVRTVRDILRTRHGRLHD